MSAFNFAVGSRIGGHRLDVPLGRSATGVVYRAVDVQREHEVALKIVHTDIAADPRYRRRFKREAELIARLDHDNVIHVWGCGEDAGTVYVSMELIDGPDLGMLLADGPMALDRALVIVSDVAAALDAAHATSIVHRHVKPQNVLVRTRGEREQAVVSDFGLAKLTSVSQAGGLYGMLDAYIAPEQVEGGPVDARADVYALGCVLFEALSGELPFRRAGPVHVGDVPPRLTERAPGVPAVLDDVLARALSRRPADRYASAGDLARAAQAAAAGAIGFRTVGSVATGRAAPHEPAPPSDHVTLEAEREPRSTGAAVRRRALTRAAEREALKSAQRESERAAARLTRVARVAGVPEHNSLRLREVLRPGERPTAAAMCSPKGESVDDTLLVATTQRVIWSRGRVGHSAVEAGELASVSGDRELTLEFRGGGTQQFSSWRIDHLQRVGSAVQTLIDKRG